jgi:hypothetical protein
VLTWQLAHLVAKEMMSDRSISSGQRYRESDPPHLSWEVIRVVQDGLDVPHATIRRMDDPSTTKFISCRTLIDPRRYRPVDSRQVEPA